MFSLLGSRVCFLLFVVCDGSVPSLPCLHFSSGNWNAYAGLFYLEICNLCLILSMSTYRWEFVMSLRSNSGLELLSRV